MKLYSGRLSMFTLKVRIALHEKGLPFETIVVPFTREKGYYPKPAELLAINPKGQVPVLIDEDVEVYDSTLIRQRAASTLSASGWQSRFVTGSKVGPRQKNAPPGGSRRGAVPKGRRLRCAVARSCQRRGVVHQAWRVSGVSARIAGLSTT